MQLGCNTKGKAGNYIKSHPYPVEVNCTDYSLFSSMNLSQRVGIPFLVSQLNTNVFGVELRERFISIALYKGESLNYLLNIRTNHVVNVLNNTFGLSF